jgi:anaerobic sulfite reductase subunit A
MGYVIEQKQLDLLLQSWQSEYLIFAPKRFTGGGRFSDTDCIRYGEITSADEIVFDEKSQYSFKEALVPVSETLFFFTEDQTREAKARPKGAVIFMRSCDINALRRLDEMYLHNGPADYYYKRLRDNIKIVLMGCSHSFESCFCVSMGTSQTDNYDMSIDRLADGSFAVDCKDTGISELFEGLGCAEQKVEPAFVSENSISVSIPQDLTAAVAKSSMWREYDTRCINCGRCNFVCPTCTCFTMQDLYYSENGRVGERRRIWASCMVDGFTDVAGGGSYRQKNGDRMRFKVLHKVLDFRERNGYNMCVGCGRCDDICPEYISFSGCINKLETTVREVSEK